MSVIVFTDGSCMKRKVPIAGYGIYFPNKELPNISRKFKHSPITNQRAELYAIYVALILVIKKLTFENIQIYTDSEYSINCLTTWVYQWKKNQWKTANKSDVKNQDILKPLYDILKKYKDKINFTHVRSHTGADDFLSEGNRIADTLATMGSQKE